MDLLGLAEFTAVYTLRNWTPFLLDLYERTSFVVASRRPMTYDHSTGVSVFKSDRHPTLAYL
jgi:hypothetical protein